MCFHSKQSKKAQEIEHRYRAKFEEIDMFEPTEHYNAFSFPKTPVITNDDSKKIEMISWGLIPKWANENWNRTYTLNARIETIHEKVSFKNNVENRCLVLVNGFYEWQHIKSKKIKHLIDFNNELFCLAGIYSEYKNKKTYTIVTTEAQGIMRQIHNSKLRMPIALYTDEQINNWLVGENEFGCYDFNTKKCI